MPLQDNGPAPYTTATAATTVLDFHRDRGLTSPVTHDVLIRAGVPESLARRTFQSLQLLDLLDDQGRTTETFETLRQARGEEEYRETLEKWLRDVYNDVLTYGDPSRDSLSTIQEAFRTFEPAGQRKAMASLLVGLWRYAGLPISEDGYSSESTPRRRTSSPRKRQSSPQKARGNTPRNREPVAIDAGLPPSLIGLLQELPADRTWTSRRREAFLRAFEAAVDLVITVDDERVSMILDQRDE